MDPKDAAPAGDEAAEEADGGRDSGAEVEAPPSAPPQPPPAPEEEGWPALQPGQLLLFFKFYMPEEEKLVFRLPISPPRQMSTPPTG